MRLARSVRSSIACEGLERERRLLIQAVEERKAARNAGSQEVARRKRAGEPADDLIATGRALGDEIGRLEQELADAEGQLARDPARDPEHHRRRRARRRRVEQRHRAELGRRRARPTGVRPHWEIAAEHGLFDLERASKISGSGFVVFRGSGSRLVRALLNFFLDVHSREHGYEEVWPPVLVNRATHDRHGPAPEVRGRRLQDRRTTISSSFPTAEVPVTNLYRDEILDGAELPKAFVRVHALLSPRGRIGGEGHARHPAHARVRQGRAGALLRRPRRPRRSSSCCSATPSRCCSGSASRIASSCSPRATPASPARRRTTSRRGRPASARGSRSARAAPSPTSRRGARTSAIRPAKGEKPRFVHTLNGSGLAFPRTIACILEHYQQPDGTVIVPEVLRPYVGSDRIG